MIKSCGVEWFLLLFLHFLPFLFIFMEKEQGCLFGLVCCFLQFFSGAIIHFSGPLQHKPRSNTAVPLIHDSQTGLKVDAVIRAGLVCVTVAWIKPGYTQASSASAFNQDTRISFPFPAIVHHQTALPISYLCHPHLYR
jgi:hypothetical protein